MKFIKNLGISLLYVFLPIISILFILTIFNYFNIISYKIFRIMSIILVSISLIIGGYKMGNNSNDKGWLEGLKLGFIISIFYVVINYLIFSIRFQFKDLIYYIIIIGTSILGSIIGINKKKKN